MPQPEIRLLLDQGFPKPRHFAVQSLDATVEVTHLSDFDPRLSQVSTPDWKLYCIAADAGFDALVARDHAQLEQATEMFVLSRLRRFSVVTWRKPIEDPIREWGQMLAYLPEVKKILRQAAGKAILLPAPSLSVGNLHEPEGTVGLAARHRSVSVEQIRREAWSDIEEHLAGAGDPPERFAHLIGARARTGGRSRPRSR